jgi:hypothetical protein
MGIAATAPGGIDLRSIADAIAPGKVRFDPLGLVTGYKAYQIHTALAAKSDAELACMGLQRKDLPGVAMSAVKATQAS